MKTALAIAIVTLLPSLAAADLGHKAPLKADFHNMIVNSYHERATLANEVNGDVASAPVAKVNHTVDTKRVTDFVDVEVGWGEAPKMVDRRFDSIGPAVIKAGNP